MNQGRQRLSGISNTSLLICSLVSLWLVIVGSSFYWNKSLINNNANHLSSARAVMIHKLAKIVIDWNSQHQSVYTKTVDKNDHLPQVKDKDYTLVSPGEMFEQFTALLDDKTLKIQLIHSNIIDKNYQQWQVNLLKFLISNPKVYFKLIDGQFRYMALINSHRDCDNCASALSITFPQSYLSKSVTKLQQQNAYIHLSVFLMLCAVSIFASLKIISLILDLQAEKQQRDTIITNKTDHLKQEIKQHKIARKELQRLATHDPLTGIRNRRYLTDVLNHEVLRYQRYESNFSLLILDIDYFKKINDSYGHDCGDKMLIEFAKIIKGSLRKSDIFARYGGEEFAIVATNTQLDSATRFAQKLCRDISNMTLNYREHEIKITVSIGISSPTLLKTPSVSSLIRLTDQALYQAKHNGRNCAVSAEKQI